MERAQRIPFLGMAGEIVFRRRFASRANGGEMAAVLGAARGEGGVVALRGVENARRRLSERRGTVLPDRAAQEDPAAFLAPLGEPGVAQDADVARDARLALAEHLCKLSDGQFHMREQAHHPQPGRVRQGAKQGLNSHRAAYKDFFI